MVHDDLNNLSEHLCRFLIDHPVDSEKFLEKIFENIYAIKEIEQKKISLLRTLMLNHHSGSEAKRRILRDSIYYQLSYLDQKELEKIWFILI